eukprot:TRINITY_DN14985_c0_g1_i1.p1 TRINITY_DN14985_c0_g1~~TRINITY_DN14985_c0_g1_i1.p1  ORF type:complete len:915 (-),score=223.58 TRINITY_DN14985_c0_g1_i1:53-2473(-)
METKVPFCSAQYRWTGFSASGEEGLSNMGLMTMKLIDFMCGQLSWTLAVVNGGRVGQRGEVREQQLMFKAPHPMNLVAPHLMIELRSAGFVQLCADLEDEHRPILDSLDEYFADRFQAELLDDFDDFCDRYYRVGEGVFKGTAGSLDSNFGLLTTEVCDKVAGFPEFPGWSLVACNSGNYGEQGEHSEQCLVFRRDEHPLGDAAYLMVVLNEQGNIEVNGKQVRGVHQKLDRMFTSRNNRWKCERAGQFTDGEMMCRRYTWEAFDMMQANADIIAFFELQGWEMQVCSQQIVTEDEQRCREQQLLFRPGKTEVGTVEPHLLVELYAGEGKEELYEDEELTQVLANQFIRIKQVGTSREITEALAAIEDFVVNNLSGGQAPTEDGIYKYNVNVFMCRGRFENNLAQWTMRVCDFLVDRLGWSFIVCSLCNMGDVGQHRLQQLVFRFDGDKREMPVARTLTNRGNAVDNSAWAEDSPSHWVTEEVKSGEKMQQVLRCTPEEIEALQAMFDSTYRRVLTRDRAPDDDNPGDEEMPFRLEVVNAFRSEHGFLNHRFQQRRLVAELPEDFEPFETKTSVGPCEESLLHAQLLPGDAYLFHGTNPSSAMSILKTGFVLDHAGSTTGTMYGGGIYLAECSSKSDEYGRDDGGNSYPSLLAMLVCRSFVGKPLVVTKAGAHTTTAAEEGYDCVCGDRESVVGTYREFVFFDEASVYPEYTVIYRRQYDAERVPESMNVPTSGTTGRFWQVKGPGGWKNLPAEVNKMLIQAKRDGETDVVSVVLHGTEYEFNIATKSAVNKRTETTTQMRAPMHG